MAESPGWSRNIQQNLHAILFTIQFRYVRQQEKIIQLYKMLSMKHCSIVIGSTGAGKSVIINTLIKAQQEMGVATKLIVLNPKVRKPPLLKWYCSGHVSSCISRHSIQRLVRWPNCMDTWIRVQPIGWMDYLRIFSVTQTNRSKERYSSNRSSCFSSNNIIFVRIIGRSIGTFASMVT